MMTGRRESRLMARLGCIVIGAILVSACPPTTERGTLLVDLSGPTGEATALRISIRGGVVDEVSSPPGGGIVYQFPSDTGAEVMLFQQQPGGTILRVSVPDKTVQYTATVLEAADSDNQLLATAGYSLTIRPMAP